MALEDKKNFVKYLENISNAISHYHDCGYQFINAPWFVSDEAIKATAPPGKRLVSGFIGNLVASGEQSFIQIMLDGDLKQGMWQCATPCFRDEFVIDYFHLNYFFKLELIEIVSCSLFTCLWVCFCDITS